jgi:hypothetical protein
MSNLFFSPHISILRQRGGVEGLGQREECGKGRREEKRRNITWVGEPDIAVCVYEEIVDGVEVIAKIVV